MAEPEADGRNVDEAQKAFGSFVVAGGSVAQIPFGIHLMNPAW